MIVKADRVVFCGLFLLLFASIGIFAGALDPSFAPVIESKPPSPLRLTGHAVQPDGKIVVGGIFDTISGEVRRNIARLNPNGSTDDTFQVGTGVDDSPVAFAFQSDGKIIVGGFFTTYNGIVRNYLARLNADGSLDVSFAPVINNFVYDIAVQADGKIIIGGEFSTINGTPVQPIARLNGDGSLDTGFSATNTDVSNPVRTIAFDGTKIMVGGDSLGGGSREPFLRLNNDGTTDFTFTIGTGITGAVNDIVVQPNGQYLIGGTFNDFNGSPAPNSIARINNSGTLDAGFSSGLAAFNEVRRIALQTDGKLFITGNFTFYNSTPVGGLARLNSNGTLDPAFASAGLDAPLNNGLNVLSDGKLLVSGNFGFYGALDQSGIVRVNPDGTPDTTFRPRTGRVGTVSDIVEIGGGKLLIVGNFSYVNNVAREKVAVLLPNGSLDPLFNPGSGVVGSVNSAFRQSDGKLLIAGDFTSYNGTPRENVARVNIDGTLDTSFNAGVMDSFAGIEDVAQTTDGKIVVVGNFGAIGGAARNFVARLNTDGSVDSAFTSPFLDGSVLAVLPLPDGKTYVGGGTLTTSSTFYRGIVRLNADGTIDNSFNIGSGANGIVRTLARQTDGRLIIGGGFLSYNGVNYRAIARLETNGSIDLGFNPGSGPLGTVTELATDLPGRVFIGGNMPGYDGITVGNVARLRSNGSYDQSFPAGTGSNRAVSALALQSPASLIVACGTAFDGSPRGGLARIANTSNIVPNFDYDGDGRTDLSVFRPSNGQWWLKRSSTGTIAATFGTSADKPVPADFTGDGKTDVAIWRESTGEWFILRSENSTFYSFAFGTAGDTPVVGDFDGDGRYDYGVFRESTGTWFIQRSFAGLLIEGFGINGDSPIVGDFDGDRISDIAIYRPSNGQWWIRQSTAGVIAHAFGVSTDRPVPGDWTGDGKSDVAFWRPSTGEWFVLRSEDFSFYSFPFGNSSDIPVAADYDGNGVTDAAVFRPSTSTWYAATQTNGTIIESFGVAGDVPTPAAYVP